MFVKAMTTCVNIIDNKLGSKNYTILQQQTQIVYFLFTKLLLNDFYKRM